MKSFRAVCSWPVFFPESLSTQSQKKRLFGWSDARAFPVPVSSHLQLKEAIMNFIPSAIAISLVLGVSLPAFAGKRLVPKQYKTIQAAVDAANPGDTILIGKGVYKEEIFVETANLTIRPAKKGKKGKVTIDGQNTNYTLLFGFGSDGCVVRDLVITNPGDGAGIALGFTTGVTVSGCTVKGGSSSASIMMSVVLDCQVINSKVQGASEIGIIVRGALNSSIKNCVVADSGTDGVLVAADGFTLTGNTVLRSGENGIVLGDYPNQIACSGSLISGNRVEGNSGSGILVGTPSSQCVVEDNVAKKCAFGIYVGNTSEHLVNSNRVAKSGYDGFLVEDTSLVTFHKNVSKDSGRDNFSLQSDFANSYLNLVKNRSRRAGRSGFLIEGDNHSLIQNDARKSGLLNPAGLDFETTFATSCLFLGNSYVTSDF